MLVDQCQTFWAVEDYNLGATLGCGQAFRWRFCDTHWEGVVGRRWVWLRADPGGITAGAAEPVSEWTWLEAYLQVHLRLDEVLSRFPMDEPLRQAVAVCRGLRLLRQDPWECLASFILSSTKQIAQIGQIVETLCRRYGERLRVPPGHEPAFGFPSACRLASCSEEELRACRMGFRAPYLLAAARAVAEGRLDLSTLSHLSLEQARAELLALPGVGRKIADCVLLFSCGFQEVFPVDVWVMRALQALYFPRGRPGPSRLRAFADSHFGPCAGYAQQYLFHYMRLRAGRAQGA